MPSSSISLPHTSRSPVGEFAWDAETVQLLVLSAGGNLLQWNQAAREGLGSHAALREGEPVWALLAPNSGLLLRASMEEARSHPVRCLLTFTDEETFAFTLSCALYWMGDACHLFGEQRVAREQRMNEELLALTGELARVCRDHAQLAARLERTLADLQESHWLIRKIQEHLPICAVCHHVRAAQAEESGWESLVEFLARNGLWMTHGYCPECEAAAFDELDRALPPHPCEAATGQSA